MDHGTIFIHTARHISLSIAATPVPCAVSDSRGTATPRCISISQGFVETMPGAVA